MGKSCTQLRQLRHPSNQVTNVYTNRENNQEITKLKKGSRVSFFTPYIICNDMYTLVHVQMCINPYELGC